MDLGASGGFISKTVLVESGESYSDYRASGNCVTRICVTLICIIQKFYFLVSLNLLSGNYLTFKSSAAPSSSEASISEPENLEEASHDKSGFVWQVVGAIIGTLHLHPFWFPLGHSEKVMHLSNWWVTSQQAFCKRRGRNAHIPRWKFYIIVSPSKAQQAQLDRNFDTLFEF